LLPRRLMKRWVMISSTVVAIAVAVALVLRPSRTLDPELPPPVHIPADVRAALRGKMQRHGADMRELIMHLVVLDNDGAARIAGRVYDESTLVRSPDTERLEKFLPRRFFALEEQLKVAARRIVEAAARGDSAGQAEHFGTLTKTCVLCHESYLFDRPTTTDLGPDAAVGR
jgi:hypothetical protein